MTTQSDLLRSYNQFCPFARSLDILGERWTMLILRNLIAGPQRYKDLLDSLPGIGTNLLAARLKRLERAGIIQRRKLPPPAASTVYEFTELGRGLEEPLLALGRWGLWTLTLPAEDAFVPRATLRASLKLFFNREAAAGVHETYEYRIDDDIFHARIDDGALEVIPGPAQRPDVVITSDFESWTALGAQSLSAQEALASGKLKLEGDSAAIMHAVRIFPLPRRGRQTR